MASPLFSRRVSIVASLSSLMACVSELPHPPYVQQTTAALVAVPFPPPPARGEYVPNQPAKRAVWIDGEWLRREPRWAWRPGRWIIPPPGAAFAPWTVVRDSKGVVYMANGRWSGQDGGEIDEPSPLSEARVVSGAIIDTTGRVERTGTARRVGEVERRDRFVNHESDAGESTTK